MKHYSLTVLAGLLIFAPPPAAQVKAPIQDQQQPSASATQPLVRWVPFSAAITRVVEPGRKVVGRLYRASDGSTRNETGPSVSQVNVIGIKNLSDRVYYLWSPKTGWETRPLDAPAGFPLPPQPAAPHGAKRVREQIEGFDLVKAPTDANGATDYLAPALNYFPVKTLMPCNKGQKATCGLWLSDIKIDEQPRELFRPPTE